MSTHQLHLAKHQHHTHHADMIPGVSISYQTALSTSILRLPAHPASALTIHPREIQALWSHNHDTGRYDTVYQVDNSNNDLVIYWTMTGTHVVPGRQQRQAHTLCRIDSSMMSKHQLHLANADIIPGVSILYQTTLWTSIRRLPAYPTPTLTIHPRKIQSLWSNNHDTGSFDTLYQIDNGSSYVVIYWTMTATQVVPDRQ